MHYLLKDGGDLTVDLYEASDRAGGKVNTHIREGYTIELGPESYLARKEVMTELAEEVGLGDPGADSGQEGRQVRDDAGRVGAAQREDVLALLGGLLRLGQR